jgi:triacylglycerol lipase
MLSESRRTAARRTLATCTAALVVLLIAGAGAASAESSLADPPPGANNWSCKPTKAHPNPLVLVHGLGATMYENWFYMSPLLAQRGYCVFALTYGLNPSYPYFGGVEPIEQSAPELAAFVKRVLATTGAKKVDLVGHSEGTFMPEYWLKYLGGARYVAKYVAMTPLYQGTDLAATEQLEQAGDELGITGPLLSLIDDYCGSCTEFIAGSAMVKQLNAHGGPEVRGIRYTTIMTDHDELVVPYTSGELPPPATDFVLQKVCPADLDDHVAEAFDPVVAQLIFNALDPATAKPVSCAGIPPIAPPPS